VLQQRRSRGIGIPPGSKFRTDELFGASLSLTNGGGIATIRGNVGGGHSGRAQLLSLDQYNIVDVRTSRGVRRAQAEFAANAPMRERMAINRERLRAKRAAAKRRQRRGRPLEGTAPKETCHEGEIRNFTDGS
jgi:hypothetical protein